MAENTESGQKLSETEIRRKLLEKSAALKEKSALLKEQMEATAKACEELRNEELRNNDKKT